MSKTITVKCQHCGEEFEGSPRSKNCPDCNSLQQLAMKKNAYGALKTTQDAVRNENLTPEEKRELMRSAINDGAANYNARMTQIHERRKTQQAEQLAYDEMWRSGKFARCPDCGVAYHIDQGHKCDGNDPAPHTTIEYGDF